MRRETGLRLRLAEPLLVTTVGLFLAAVVITGRFTRYVRPGFGIWVFVAGAVLVVLGITGLVASARRRGGRVPLTGWLLLAPVLIMVLADPAAVGAYTASREPAVQPLPPRGLEPLPAGDPLAIGLSEYVQRSSFDQDSLRGRRFQLTGIVAEAGRGQGWELVQLRIVCCAADARPLRVRMLGDVPMPPEDSWVAVTGSYVDSHAGGGALLQAEGARSAKPLDPPYATS